MEDPVFDNVLTVQIDGGARDVVVHRDVEGRVVAFHSPLRRGAIECAICESGVPVRLG